MEFISFLKQSVRLTADMEAAVIEGIKRESYLKHYKLLLPGHQSKTILFIESGLARMYYLKEGGKDITHLFFG